MIPWLILAFAIGTLAGGWLAVWHLTRYGGFKIEVTWKEW